MTDYQLGQIEKRFADIIWEHEPVQSGRLVEMCADELGWKKSTTYTVLRRLCEKGIFVNENGVVRSLVGKSDFAAGRSSRFVDEAFDGSLPAFIAAFMSGKSVSDEDAEKIRRMIDEYRGGTQK